MSNDDRAIEQLELLLRTDQHQMSVFRPERLLAESRRQRRLAEGPVPAVCLLDPDGDVVRHVITSHGGTRACSWACYHTDLIETSIMGVPLGLVGHAVGAPFAVLVAEQLFASGCRLLLSITSAGLLVDAVKSPSFLLIERALRGEGTSYRYLASSSDATADPAVLAAAERGIAAAGVSTQRGVTWTTDAPFRETPSAIAAAVVAGAVAVEMEAAALYAFARASSRPVVCFAQITNQLGQVEGDFEKGPTAGASEALTIVAAAAHGWLTANPGEDQ